MILVTQIPLNTKFYKSKSEAKTDNEKFNLQFKHLTSHSNRISIEIETSKPFLNHLITLSKFQCSFEYTPMQKRITIVKRVCCAKTSKNVSQRLNKKKFSFLPNQFQIETFN